MKICPKCDFPNSDQAKNCGNCGNTLSSVRANPQQPTGQSPTPDGNQAPPAQNTGHNLPNNPTNYTDGTGKYAAETSMHLGREYKPLTLICMNIKDKFDWTWGYIGWILFLNALVLFLVPLPPVWLFFPSVVLHIAWWFVDAFEERASWVTMIIIALGITSQFIGVFLFFSMLPHLGAWAWYWTKIKE